MGDLNARTAALAPTVEGQLPRMSTDKVLNTRGHALLSLLTQQKLLLLSGTMQLSHQATSLGGAGPGPPQSVVDYAIASCTAAPWVTRVIVGDAWPMLSDHCPLMLSLALPALPASSGSSLATLHAYWEPGAQARWRAHLSSPLFLARL